MQSGDRLRNAALHLIDCSLVFVCFFFLTLQDIQNIFCVRCNRRPLIFFEKHTHDVFIGIYSIQRNVNYIYEPLEYIFIYTIFKAPKVN